MGGKPSKFDQLFVHFQRHVNTHVIIIGLHNAGKSTILKSMDFHGNIKSQPMIGMPIETVKSGQNVQITAWDVGGPGKIRSMWEHFFGVTKGIVFVVDSTDKESLPEAVRELNVILQNKKLLGVPLIVMANKQDLSDAMTISDISSSLGLCDLNRMWDIIGTVGTTGDGVYDAVEGLTNMMRIFLRESRRKVTQ